MACHIQPCRLREHSVLDLLIRQLRCKMRHEMRGTLLVHAASASEHTAQAGMAGLDSGR